MFINNGFFHFVFANRDDYYYTNINPFDSRAKINDFKVGCFVVKSTQWFNTVIEKGNEILLRSAALKDDGSSLMSVFQMEEDRINGKDMNLLDEKISKAQENINSAVKEKGEVPNNKKLKKEYATIAAVTELKSLKSKNPYMYFDESDVQTACDKLHKLKEFTQAMKDCPKDILKDAACKEKGGNLFDVIINKTYAPQNDEINLNNNSKIPVVEHANEKAVEEKVVKRK